MKSTLKFLTLSATLILVSAAACSSSSPEPTPGTTSNGTGSGNTTSGLMCASTAERDCNGVCTNIASDSNNCGACGNVCGTGQHCQVATCTCQGSLQNCAGSCINTNANAQNCGACGTACEATQVCDRGMCAAECSVGLTNCNQGCTNPLSDPFNCGACNITCGAGQNCIQGMCTCSDGSPVCNGACTNVMSDIANCGGCGIACSVGQSCVAGTCQGGSVTGTQTTVTSTTDAATTTAGTTTTGGGGATSTVTSTTTGGTAPPGWWTYEPLNWAGCAWTGIDTVQGSTTTIVPQDFTTGHSPGDGYCVQGTVHDDYESVALLGFNLAEDISTADCSYDPADAMSEGPPGVTMGGSGIAVNFEKSVASTLRIQIQGPDGATDATDRWCATITEVSGKVFVPYSEFVTECWEGASNPVPYNNEPISAVVFLVPGAAEGNFTNYGFCINGFATGTSADDAPDGGGSGGPLEGDIGGPGSDDNDYQRVKVKGPDGKEYIIQNNNWGNASGTNQTLHYKDNSFTITQETGGSPGGGVPASFPSIFIGHNGDRQGGAFSTNDSNLPKIVNTITSIPTKFSVAKSGGSIGGEYNVSYDVWFSANDPGTAEYEDGISGFLMIWMYKPSNWNPIGWENGSRGTFSHSSGTFNVYVGPRDGSSNRPVVNYVSTTTLTSMNFDLKDFIDDAAQYGIQPGWYLTDVFGGFEIWNGAGTNGLQVTEFTAEVK